MIGIVTLGLLVLGLAACSGEVSIENPTGGAGGTSSAGGQGGGSGGGEIISPTCEPTQVDAYHLISSDDNGEPIGNENISCFQGSTNYDGSVSAFYCAKKTDIENGSVYLHDDNTQTTQLIAEKCYLPQVSRNLAGNYVVMLCKDESNPFSAKFDIKLYNRSKDELIDVSQDPNHLSFSPSFAESNMGLSLIAYTRRGFLSPQIWLAKVSVENGELLVNNELLIKNLQGEEPNGAVGYATFSPDGKELGFYSNATDLTEDASDGQTYPFSLELSTGKIVRHSDQGSDTWSNLPYYEAFDRPLSLSNNAQALSFWTNSNNFQSIEYFIYFEKENDGVMKSFDFGIEKTGSGQGLLNPFASFEDGFVTYYTTNNFGDTQFAYEIADQKVTQLTPDGLKINVIDQAISQNSQKFIWSGDMGQGVNLYGANICK